MNVGKKIRLCLFGMLAFGWLMSPWGIVQAVGDAYAIGYREVPNARGVKAQIWVPTVPSGLQWTSSPIGICQTSSCARFFETGFAKGTAFGMGNVLQQYVAYTNASGHVVWQVGLGNLAENTYYWFESTYSNNRSRWEARRDGSIVWFLPNIGWTTGQFVAVGSEAAFSGDWMGVQAFNMQYSVAQGAWVLYDYTIPRTAGMGCIDHRNPYGLVAWGPC